MITSSRVRLQLQRGSEIIKKMARRFNYKRVSNNNRHQLTFKHRRECGCGPVIVNVNIATREIITSLKHPKFLDISHLKRKVVNNYLMERIFRNPRVHTGIGRFVNLKNEIGSEVSANLCVKFICHPCKCSGVLSSKRARPWPTLLMKRIDQ